MQLKIGILLPDLVSFLKASAICGVTHQNYLVENYQERSLPVQSAAVEMGCVPKTIRALSPIKVDNFYIVGKIWEFISANQVYVIIAGVLFLAVLIFAYDAYKRRKRRRRRQVKREKRIKEQREYEIDVHPVKKSRVPSADVDKSYYYEDDYKDTDLYEERRASSYDDDDEYERPQSERRSSRSSAAPSSSKRTSQSNAYERRQSQVSRKSAVKEEDEDQYEIEDEDEIVEEVVYEEPPAHQQRRLSERPRTTTDANKKDRPKTMYV
eukprot:NODE_128_length_17019_cov_0.764480.p8 type:complete len:267 gc:universal NODE_128_length_17019_cov_0.764480:8682-9482(+)